jgi:methylmalonyl-CoA/ethylmalonyl-CoA epimerase
MTENKELSPFSKLIQVGVVVKDVEKTIKRLSDMGLNDIQPKLLPADRQEWFRDKRMYADFKIYGAMMGDTELELIQPVSGDSPHKEFLATKGEGIQHIAFRVDDLEKEIARFMAQGATILLRAKWQGGGVAYLDLNIGGLIIELIKR